MGLRLSIVTPSRPLLDAEVEQVVAPGSEGEFGVLPGHAALLVRLKAGVVRWTEAGRTRRAAISGGFAEVTQERCTVVAEEAIRLSEADRAEAEERVRETRAVLEGLTADEERSVAKRRVDIAEALLAAIDRGHAH